jgi:undecaprenyl pyrophosphate phosphatase UppP
VLLLGLNRPAATEFSFLVGIPTMLAAGGLKIFKALHHPVTGAPHENWGMVLLATVIAAVVSFIAVKWLLRYIQTHTFNAVRLVPHRAGDCDFSPVAALNCGFPISDLATPSFDY